MDPNCEGCEIEFNEAIYYQDVMGMHYATTTEAAIDINEHFVILMVDDEGRIQVN